MEQFAVACCSASFCRGGGVMEQFAVARYSASRVPGGGVMERLLRCDGAVAAV